MKIQLKRSSVLEGGSAKQPLPEQLEYGELAVNYAAADPTIFIKNSANEVIAITGTDASSNTPTLDAVTKEGNWSSNSLLVGASASSPNLQLNNTGNVITKGYVRADKTATTDASFEVFLNDVQTFKVLGTGTIALGGTIDTTRDQSQANLVLNAESGKVTAVTAETTGTITSGGQLIANAGASLTGTVTCNNSLNVTQGTSLTGAVTMGSTLTVTSSGSFGGSVTSAATTSGDGNGVLTTKGYVDNLVSNSSGGVTKIVAGSNINISPSNGIGEVTINSTGGGSTSTPTLQEVTDAGHTTNTEIDARGGIKIYDGQNFNNDYFDFSIIAAEGGNGQKTITGTGNGPIRIQNSSQLSMITLRNQGGISGAINFRGKMNGAGNDTACSMFCNGHITKNGGPNSNDTQDISNAILFLTNQYYDSEHGTKTLDRVTNIQCSGPALGMNGFSANNAQGIYVPQWSNIKDGLENVRGYLCEMRKPGAWQAKFDGDASWGGHGAVNMEDVYNTSGGTKKLVINSGGWVTSDSLNFATVTSNNAISSSVITSMQSGSSLEPREVVAPEYDYGENNVNGHGFEPTTETYSPVGWSKIRLNPADVAAIHPRLATYSWPQTERTIRAPQTWGPDDIGLTQMHNDYSQAPTADGIDYDGVVSVLVAVVQELRTELNDAKARITTLESA